MCVCLFYQLRCDFTLVFALFCFSFFSLLFPFFVFPVLSLEDCLTKCLCECDKFLRDHQTNI